MYVTNHLLHVLYILCMYVCMYVCILSAGMHMHGNKPDMYACTVCMYVLFVCTHVPYCMYVRMYVCMYSMYACYMYVCIYVMCI